MSFCIGTWYAAASMRYFEEHLKILRLCVLMLLHLHLFVIVVLIFGGTLSFCQRSLSSNSSIRVGERLYQNQTLFSRNGTFALGFFSDSPYSVYLGLWFADTAGPPKVWVANRDTPATTEAFLELSHEGNLILADLNGTIFWMSATGGVGAEEAVLLDSGNLILQGNATATSTVLWQSFDYPTNTWLQEMKVTHRTIIRSWKSSTNPATGRFSLIMHDYGDLDLLWNESVSYWETDRWLQPQRIYVDTTENVTYVLIVTFYNNATSSYYIWKERDNLRSYITLGEDGVLRSHAWNENMQEWLVLYSNPTSACEVEHICGPYGICDSNAIPFCKCPAGFVAADGQGWNQNDWSMGCVPAQPLNCSTDQFVGLNQTSYNFDFSTMSSNSNIIETTINLCEESCFLDCSCVAFMYSADNNRCLQLQRGQLVNGYTSPDFAGSIFLRVSSTSQKSTSSNRSSSNTTLIVGASTAAFIIFLLVGCSTCFIIKRRRINPSSYQGFVKFSYKELQKATNNFSQILGSGGFGSVFAGKLTDNSLVAVKKLEKLVQGEKQFLAEVITLGKIYHMNLVTLHGFCAEKSQRLLVYERLENGSLDKYLFRSSTSSGEQKLLEWDSRVAIALGTARGIAYLHEDCSDCIIHFDIKPENILLDVNFRAKVSDFGLAKLIGREFSRVITNMRGTRGYLAPEWLENMPITAKVDVYSYGMSLLELISGRRNIDSKAELEKWYFPLWAYKQMKLGNYSHLPDERLGDRYDLEQLKKLVQVAMWCIQDDGSLRPAMRQVVKMLEGTVEIVEPPVPKSLLLMEVGS